MSRAFAPSRVSKVVELWRSDLSKTNKKAASALADPAEYKNLFPDFDVSLHTESFRTNTSLKLAFSFRKRDDEDLSGIPYNTSSVKFNDDIQNVEALQNAGDAHEDLSLSHEAKIAAELNEEHMNEADAHDSVTAVTPLDPCDQDAV